MRGANLAKPCQGMPPVPPRPRYRDDEEISGAAWYALRAP